MLLLSSALFIMFVLLPVLLRLLTHLPQRDFHHRVDHWTMRQQPWQRAYKRLFYLPLAEEIQEAETEMTNTYISCSKNTIYQYIVTCPIFELCLAAERRPGKTVPKWLWEQGRM